jgi:hypothetical protein
MNTKNESIRDLEIYLRVHLYVNMVCRVKGVWVKGVGVKGVGVKG